MGPRIDFVGLFPLEVLELKGRPYTELWGAKTPRYLLPETNKVFTSNVVLGYWRAGGAGPWEVVRGRRGALGGGARAAQSARRWGAGSWSHVGGGGSPVACFIVVNA